MEDRYNYPDKILETKFGNLPLKEYNKRINGQLLSFLTEVTEQPEYEEAEKFKKEILANVNVENLDHDQLDYFY